MQRRILSTAALTAAIFPLISGARAQSGSGAQMQGGAANEQGMMALSAGTFSMQSSILAQRRASTAPVRIFAQLEAEEQQAFMQALQLTGMTIPAQVPVDAAKSEMMRRLEAAQGAEFDRAYLAGQLTGHQELLRIHTAIASGRGAAPERALSTLAVPAIKSHIAMIEMMQQHR